MSAEREAAARAYLEHLTPRDVALLTGDKGGPERPTNESALLARLAEPALFDTLFGPGEATDPLLLGVSPFLVFAAAIERANAELASRSYVAEWLGPGQHAPVFDVAELRRFLADPFVRLFLAELLASYTHVASGSVLVPTRRGVRRQRFSELDPVRLAGLLDVVSEGERPGVLRRLGDLSLFLTGVFPDYVARRGLGPVEEGRLLRAGGRPPGTEAPGGRLGPEGPRGTVGLLEELGRRWYRAAYELLPRPAPAGVAVIGALPHHFGQARRILALVTERFFSEQRDRWFGLGSA